VDLFILAGELGITISAIRHRKDLAAWGYLVIGFGASVAFNVLHVLPGVLTWGKYAVAAVPPVAAMLALAALMRQVYRLAIEADAQQNVAVQSVALHMAQIAHTNGAGPDPDATVTFDAIHDIGDQPMRRQ
jgi:hypothetical protein